MERMADAGRATMLRKPHSRLSAVSPEGTPIFLLGEQIKSESGPDAFLPEDKKVENFLHFWTM